MRLALLSDLHANRQALEACLDHARTQGVDRYAFLGDLVGYGADPVGVVEEFQLMARGNSLYLGGGGRDRPVFRDVSVESGTTMGRWAWGSMPADVDHDGWEDIVVANGYVTGRQPDDL